MARIRSITSILRRLRMAASGTRLNRPLRQAMLVEAMEPRILHSADASPALLGDFAAPQIEHRVIDTSGEFASSAAQTEQRQALEIVFVDPETPDYQTLIDDIRANGQDGRYLEVVLLDGQRDGIAQISEYLAARTDISAIHIISHGSDGAVQLGLGILDAESLSSNDAQISSWGDALTQDADLLIYGCDVAATESGRALIDNLARLTSADVAASEDSTGNAQLGGDWDFEYRVGTIESNLALSQAAQVEWYGLLAAPSLAGANDLSAIDEDPAVNPGTLVSAIIAGQVTDPDAGAFAGIAVTAVDNTNGTWQYSTNGGSNWTDFGSPSDAAARLLAADPDTYVRFVPNSNYSGTISGGLTFRAWDQTSGAAGATADTTSATQTVRDEFNFVSYGNNDGSNASWTAGWVDSQDGSPFGGIISVSGGQLVLSAPLGANDSIYREANLSGATSATLSFSYNNSLALLGGTVSLQVSNGGSYTTIATFSAGSNSGSGTFSTDISAYISGTTRIQFVVNGGLLGGTLSVDDVQISYIAPLNGGSTAFSTATASSSIIVNSVNDTPMGVPTISGTVTEDQILTADTSGISDVDGLGAFSYQWLRDGVAIGGATASTYTLGDADVGTLISMQVSYTDAQGTAESVTSVQTPAVVNVNDAPVGLPSISGTVTEDQTLTADTSGISDVDGLGTFSYQWLRDGVAIGGATASTYTLNDADVGTLISVQVSYTDAQGTAEGPLTSPQTAAVANVNDAPVGVPTITGTVTEGQVLTADTSGISDADGLGAFSYQWLRDGVAIGGATASTYTLGGADVGTRISVAVAYSDSNGTNEGPLASVQTAFVANVPPTVPSGPAPIIPVDAGTPPVVTPPTPPTTGDPGSTPAESSDGNIDSEAPGTATEDEASVEETAAGGPADSTPAGRSNQNALLGSGSEQATRAGRGSNVAYGSGDLRLLWATPELLEATLADIALAPGDAQHAIQTALAALQSTDLLNELDRLRDDFLEESRIEANTIALTTAATLGLSVGYVFWLLRGGVLLSTVLSSLPAWRFVDPLPILGRLEDDDDEAGEPDESLESMVARKNRAGVDKKSVVAPA